MSDRTSKQVIVMRKDLGMRKGKMIAQGAHASVGALEIASTRLNLSAVSDWYRSGQTKICVSVDSGDELLAVKTAAEEAGLPVKIITDAGHTEFHGIPTLTCLAIGPAWTDDIDKITGGLKLL